MSYLARYYSLIGPASTLIVSDEAIVDKQKPLRYYEAAIKLDDRAVDVLEQLLAIDGQIKQLEEETKEKYDYGEYSYENSSDSDDGYDQLTDGLVNIQGAIENVFISFFERFATPEQKEARLNAAKEMIDEIDREQEKRDLEKWEAGAAKRARAKQRRQNKAKLKAARRSARQRAKQK